MNKFFIFYIPGSMGSLLSVLIKSQIDDNFSFRGFSNKTAHNHCTDMYNNTHSYTDFIEFKKNKKNIKQHLDNNIIYNSGTQRCDINWCEPFIDYNNYDVKKIVCYISDPQLKINNLYYKLKNFVLLSAEQMTFNFKINKSHKDYEKIIFLKAMKWWAQCEKKYLEIFPKIDMLEIIKKKEYFHLSSIIDVKNKDILDEIIDDYNSKQQDISNVFRECNALLKVL